MRLKLTSWVCFLLLSIVGFGHSSLSSFEEETFSAKTPIEDAQRAKLLQPAGPFCITDAPVNLIASTLGGTWSGTGITDAVNGVFDPSIAGAGDHTITYVSIAGTENMNIHVDAAVDATINPAGPFCEASAPVNLTAVDAGGVWAGPGITVPAFGTFDPSFATPGSHIVTYTVTIGACSDNDTETFLVDAYPDSDWTAIGPFCITDPAVNIVPNTPGGVYFGTGITDGVLGTFDPAAAGVGTVTVTYSIVNGVCNSITSKDIEVFPLVDATITPQAPLCDNDNNINFGAVDPGGVWSGSGIVNSATGLFDPEIATPGIHIITYDIDNGGCTDSDTETITVFLSPIPDFPPLDDVCETDPPFNIIPVTPGGTWSGTGITDAFNGTFDPATAGVGSHMITYTISNANCTAFFIRRITVDPLVVATITPVGPFCEDDSEITLTAVDPGGTWSGNGITDPVAGTFDPASATPGTHTITYDVVLGACSDVGTTNIQVDALPNSSISPAGPFCTIDPATNLIAVTPGGTWSGNGITDPINGTFNPLTATAGDHTITYTLVNGACTSISTFDIHVDDDVDATITPVPPVCDSDPAFDLTAADTGGTWSGTGITDPIAGTFDPTSVIPGTHTITYTIISGNCSDTDTEDIIVNASPDASISPAGPFCASDASVNLVSVTAGGTWSGTGITDVVNGTFDPFTADGGDNLITYTLTVGPCTNSSTITIHVDADVDATITPAGPFCTNDAATNLTAVSTGGTWSGLGITDVLNGTFDPVIGVGTYNITYDVINGLCSDSDNISIDVLLSPDATITDPGEFCSDDPAVNLTAATPGGTWAGTGITDVLNGTFDPSSALDGANNITYTVTVGSCTEVGNITINVYDAAVDATILTTGPYCITDGIINLSAVSPGGTWSGIGITDAVNGTFDPTVAGIGSTSITYDVGNPACFDTDTQSIQIDDTLSAIITPAGPFCETEAASNLTSADAGGTWSGTGITDIINGTFDPGAAGVGTHTITYTISQGACTNVDTYDIVVNVGVDPTITPAGPFCETDVAVNLVAAEAGGTWSGIGITDAINGTFDPNTATPGIHTITYSVSNGPCSASDTEQITVDLNPDSDWNSVGPFCENDLAVNIIPFTPGGVFTGPGITDGVLGTFDPLVAGDGTHPITYTLINGACVSTTIKDIIVYADVDATITPAGPFCDNENSILLTAAQTGGTWSGNGITNAAAGIFSPAVAGVGIHLITYDIGNVNCNDSDAILIEVYLSPDPDYPPLDDVCETDLPFNIVPVNLGGIWSGDGIVNPILGTFDPADAGVGSHMITYSISNINCTASLIRRIYVDPMVDATITPAGPFCVNDSEQILTAVDPGGTWSGPGITNATTGAFNPTIAGVGIHPIIYGLAVGACEDTATENIQVDLMPITTINPAGPFCETEPTINLTAATPGGTWSGTGIIESTLGTFDPGLGSGDFTITYTLVNGACTSVSTTSIHVDASVDATITPVGQVCEYDLAFNLVAVDAGGTWSGIGITDASNGTFDPILIGPGLYTITYDIINGTCSDSDTEDVDVSADPNSSISAAGPFCADALPVNLVSVTPGGIWTGTGITDDVLGIFDPGTALGGEHLITYTITSGACTNDSTITIHVDADVDATITPAGPFCQFDPASNLSAISPGGTWTGTGITDAIAGTFNPTTAGVGIYNISYDVVNGLCSDSDNINITVIIAPDATITDPGEFCSDDPAVNLTAATPGGTWAGSGITNAILGTFNPAGANDGGNDVTYTVTSGGCTSVGTFTIYVYDAAVDATITSVGPYCISDGQMILTAVSSGGTWSGPGIIDVINGIFDPTVATVGSHLITYDVGNPACFDTDTQLIQIDDSISAIITSVAPVCASDPIFNFTAANIGGTWGGSGITDLLLGTFNPSIPVSGIHTITYTTTQGACTNIDTFDMQVDAVVDATITPAGPFCEDDASTSLVAADAGGTWSGTGIMNATTGLFHPGASGPGDWPIDYQITNGACSDTDTETIHVDSNPNTTITPVGPYCESDADVNLIAATGGGVWTGTGITDAILGTFSPSFAGDGSHLIGVEITNGACISSSTTTIVVDELYSATITPAGPFCNTDAAVDLVAASTGGVWSGTGIIDIVAGTFHPGASGPGDWLIDYQISNGVCSDTDNITIHVDEYFDATISPIHDFCEADLAEDLVAANPGGLWSGNGITAPITGTFDPFLAQDGDHTIAYEITNGACYSSDTETVHVDDQPDPTITAAGPFCQNETAVVLTAADAGGVWSGTGITNAALGVFNPTVVLVGDHIITYDIVNGECSASDTETIHVDTLVDTSLASVGPFCETEAPIDLVEPSPGGTWSGTGLINLTTGIFDPSFAEDGIHPITYTVITGACTSSSSTNIQVDDEVDATITPVGPFCETDASVFLTAVSAGGTWSGSGVVGAATGEFNPVVADIGTHPIGYYVENGVCNDTDNIDIIVEDAPEVNILTTGPFCVTGANEAFVADVLGGNWSGDGIDVLGNFNPGLALVGTHTITYTLTVGACVVVEQVDIVVDELIDAEITSTGPFCFNDASEYLTTLNPGGVWSGNGVSVDGLFSPSAAGVGNHDLTYEITNGACVDGDTQGITVNPNPDATITGPAEVCLNTPSFDFSAVTPGGVWSGTGMTNVISGTFDPADAGVGDYVITYFIAVAGCDSTDQFNITVHDIPDATMSGLSSDYCIYDAAVTVDVSPSGGVLSGGNVAGTQFDPGLAGVGVHQITYVFADINTCTDTAYFDLEVHDIPGTSIAGIDPTYCPYPDTVHPVLLPVGGLLEGPGAINNTFVPFDAGPGNFDLQYSFTDVHGCADTSYVNVTVFDTTYIEFTVTQPLCHSDSNGNITTTITGSPGPHTYLWSNEDDSITPDIVDVHSGWYYLSVTDGNTCIKIDSVLVNEPDTLIVDISTYSDVSCYALSDAWALADVSGGTLDYLYLWNDTEFTDTALLDSVPIGTYIVIVTDANLCQATDTIFIEQPDTLSLSFTNINNVSCYDFSDGEVTVAPAGGTEPYFPVWNDSQNTNDTAVTDLITGYYTVTLTDDHNCQIVDSILITQPDSMYFDAIVNPVLCTQQAGSAGISVHGGTTPYDYDWDNGDTVPAIYNLSLGTYQFIITDANGCVVQDSIVVTADGEITANITQTLHNLCYKDEIAELIAFSLDGAYPFQYEWSNFVIDSVNSNLPADNYYLIMTDIWGCEGIDSITVTEPDLLVIEVTYENVLCRGMSTGSATVEVEGGTEPYYPLWSNNDINFTASNLGPGPISVTLTDANGCTETDSGVLTEPSTGIEISLTVEQVTCFGANDGSVNSFASGGNPPYYYSWYVNGTEIEGHTIHHLGVGAYTLVVMDNHECTVDTTVYIYQVNSLIATAETGNTSCIGNYDGYMEIFAGGGTEPYSYYFMDILWNSHIIDSLYRGDYYVTVRDSNDCEFNLGPIAIYDTNVDCLRIPAAFSPNGDGYNDEFYIENLHLYPRSVVQIFNRWGQLLYEDLGINGFWDGTYNGNPVPTGAYLYNIILNINEDPRVGTVTIVR